MQRNPSPQLDVPSKKTTDQLKEEEAAQIIKTKQNKYRQRQAQRDKC